MLILGRDTLDHCPISSPYVLPIHKLIISKSSFKKTKGQKQEQLVKVPSPYNFANTQKEIIIPHTTPIRWVPVGLQLCNRVWICISLRNSKTETTAWFLMKAHCYLQKKCNSSICFFRNSWINIIFIIFKIYVEK